MKKTPLIVNPTAGQGGPERRRAANAMFGLSKPLARRPGFVFSDVVGSAMRQLTNVGCE